MPGEKPKKIGLSDLTKEELLNLIHSKCLDHYFDDRDIGWIRYESMVNKARRIMDAACERMNKLRGENNLSRYLDESKKWDHGMELMNEAQRLIDDHLA